MHGSVGSMNGQMAGWLAEWIRMNGWMNGWPRKDIELPAGRTYDQEQALLEELARVKPPAAFPEDLEETQRQVDKEAEQKRQAWSQSQGSQGGGAGSGLGLDPSPSTVAAGLTMEMGPPTFAGFTGDQAIEAVVDAIFEQV